MVKTTIGAAGTLETEEYNSNIHLFISFTDTRGTELDVKYRINDVKTNTLDFINKRLSIGDQNEAIHCLLYYARRKRFQEIEKEV